MRSLAYDILILSRQFNFDGEALTTAIIATFRNRGTTLTSDPFSFSIEFANDSSKQLQWASFVRKSKLVAGIKARTVTRLVVDRLDRLTRRLVDLLVLLELFADYQVELVVVNDPNFSNSPTSRLMTHIVGAASEFQLDITRERMADARAALKRRGKRVAGRIPFGYQADPDTKALRPHPEEAIVVRDFFKLAALGSKPSELVALANLQGWENHAGETGRWSSRGITKLLSNPIYTGRIHNGTETLPGEHDSIVNQ